MSEFVSVAKVGDIPTGEGRAFEVNDEMVAVFNNDGEYLAIDDMCPHQGASLAVGHFDSSDCTVTCPWHAWRFDTRDGTWCDNRRIKIDVYEVRIEDEQIQVRKVEAESDVTEAEKDLSPSDPNIRIQLRIKMNKKESAKEPEDANPKGTDLVSITEFQNLIRDMYYEKDVARGVSGTFMWLMEEVGELSSALRETSSGESAKLDPAEFAKRRHNLQEEFADVLAWLATIANVVDVDLNRAVNEKYGSGCPGCHEFICTCPDAEKP